MIEMDENFNSGARLKVIGIGGCGGNAVNTMIESGLDGIEFMAANTDSQALEKSLAGIRVQLGAGLTKGLGAGANPEVGRNAALESKEQLTEAIRGADMVFVTAGMGGGTGTGAGPVVAEAARAAGALVVAVVTKPFAFEGQKKMKQAEDGLKRLREVVDTVITIPNQRLLSISSKNTSLKEAFMRADEVLMQAVKGISDVITIPGLVNVDFADVRTIMSEMGQALMGSGTARGENRAAEAARKAISSPLLEDISISGAKGILINITGSSDMTIHDVDEASSLIHEEAHEDANIIFGAVIDESMGEEVRVTVIATGFGKEKSQKEIIAPAMIIEENLDVPTVLRRGMDRGGELKSNEIRRLGKLGGFNVDDEDLYDTPTFLRKQAD
ncbi:MAG TPA: cell division protein FtsZ [Deltaproteobacteria bacterium]|nr:MAG: cell division protein FtsZ [Deltaproteobacteria bacterium GWA2_55_82]OGQ62740.1 MAG: cell division protein FtsZ [Deltaproteobacteria bacterium RIFCSPLOWO2_02_FULL_55_12]OIJ75117.1 MAG: cell division protein FtsZ [Deltaproteobacteria bacterium GWC2_55_46]HBG46887.1 cell division protein FtsZ [Deltaproteobacteria bacterium]HCY11055.1 cell division protein FtsZ [Deltaproteobacteria bacterium]